jgi:hypothetical protein
LSGRILRVRRALRDSLVYPNASAMWELRSRCGHRMYLAS